MEGHTSIVGETSGVLACSGTLRRCKRMIFLNISAKFLGTRSDFLIDQPKKYTLSALFVDVYLFTCSKLPDPSKKYKAEVKIPWSSEYKLIENDRDL
ncbi:hypothetical protein ACOSQ3_010388 [Xanthoceras sorbifolium]